MCAVHTWQGESSGKNRAGITQGDGLLVCLAPPPVLHSSPGASIASPLQAATGHIKHVPLKEFGTVGGLSDQLIHAQDSPRHSKARHHQA